MRHWFEHILSEQYIQIFDIDGRLQRTDYNVCYFAIKNCTCYMKHFPSKITLFCNIFWKITPFFHLIKPLYIPRKYFWFDWMILPWPYMPHKCWGKSGRLVWGYLWVPRSPRTRIKYLVKRIIAPGQYCTFVSESWPSFLKIVSTCDVVVTLSFPWIER